jgi:methylated-DNA-[protein]-cysteine S-methyltransferase
VGLTAILWEGEDYQRTKLPVPERDDSNPILLQAALQLAEYFEKKERHSIYHWITTERIFK